MTMLPMAIPDAEISEVWFFAVCSGSERRGVYDISVRILNIDDRPTDLHVPHILEHFKWPSLCNVSSDPFHVCTAIILCHRAL